MFQSSMLRSVRDRHDVHAALEGAIERRELVVHYQPIVDLHLGRVAGAEALVRWPRPDRGLVPPAEFIPLAEETGLVVELDRFVLRQTCRQMAGWVADAGPLLLHVNLSAHYPLRGDLVEHPEQAAALAELGCHLARGFHFSHPVPAAELAARLAGQQPVAGLRHPA